MDKNEIIQKLFNENTTPGRPSPNTTKTSSVCSISPYLRTNTSPSSSQTKAPETVRAAGSWITTASSTGLCPHYTGYGKRTGQAYGRQGINNGSSI